MCLGHNKGNISGMHRSLSHPLATVRHRMWAGLETNKTKKKRVSRLCANAEHCKNTNKYSLQIRTNMKTGNYLLSSYLQFHGDVSSCRYNEELKILFWLQYTIHPIHKKYMFFSAICDLFITVTFFIRKDHVTNINKQLKVVDCRGWKRSITKSKFSFPLSFSYSSKTWNFDIFLHWTRNIRKFIVLKCSLEVERAYRCGQFPGHVEWI